MPAPQSIIDLVNRFQRNLVQYKRDDYKETRIRVEFIDPFFEALGWDVRNTKGYAEQYKDVVHEDAIKVRGSTRAPDYCFRIGGTRKFFLEVKKPSVDVGGDVGPAYQLRRYAWSAKLPLSILTDFEELAVYDCRHKPKPGDKAGASRIMLLNCNEYIHRWDEISSVFSREAVLQGSFDRYAQDVLGKRGTSEVDAEFLKEIEGWRDTLARNIALRNTGLSVYELNFVVQRTIDRIIFLRMCEDRGIEEYGRLLALTNGGDIYSRLGELYRQADARYNAGLFDFRRDTLSKSLKIDDKVIKPILTDLYYPRCPYEFSMLPADVLGQVYEQFLGKVIRLTPAHRAVVEEKPEVKKAGGVYYTPTYIVAYIVENAVGKLIEGKTPKQISKLRILDPACGSGSFLLGAYQHLLDYHLQWYGENDPEKDARRKKPPIYQGPGGGWRLTADEKKRILINNIFGVDIDRQAVEVTKLSLLLKVLEGETDESIGQQLLMWRQPALPDLADNIKCGNSLIGPDYFAGQLMPDVEEMRRVNLFDWEKEFRAVMTAGGFDAVIGNPPYIRIQIMKEWAPTEVEFYKQAYRAASKGNYDIYVVFVERALELLNNKGRMGYILPHKFFQSKYGEPLRKLIAVGKHLSEIVHFGDQQVFSGASTYTCLLFLTKQGTRQFTYKEAHDLDTWRVSGYGNSGKVETSSVTSKEWNFIIGPAKALFLKLNQIHTKFGDITSSISQGIRTSANKIFVLSSGGSTDTHIEAFSESLKQYVALERELTAPFVLGREIKPYEILYSGLILVIPYRGGSEGVSLIQENDLLSHFPKTYSYLNKNKKTLEEREDSRMKGPGWYGYVYPKNIDLMKKPKILVPDIAARSSFALDENGIFAFTSGYGIVIHDGLTENRKFILGLLNSNLLDFFFKQVSTVIRGGYYRYFKQFIEMLPIRLINFDDEADAAMHDRMVALVERMLALHKQLAAAAIPEDRTLLQRQIDATDRQIDALVYELYDLSEEEIRIVENA
ncbi:MAG: Eco57I restriction-modification methylase domain-containing protein [Anaerolineales bacterium]|nr:Eco57I restriction-modification methylase domain-containing protein [Anaerolineales bacterium]